MVMPWSMSNFLIGPCLIVMLPADTSTLVTCPAIRVDWASPACDQAQSAIAMIKVARFFMGFSFLQWFSSVVRHGCRLGCRLGCCFAARFDDRELDGRAARRRGLGTTSGLLDRPRVLIGDGALRMSIGTWIAVVAGSQALAHLHHREHAAHLKRTELAEAGHHRQGVVGERHLHAPHLGHAV